MNPNVSPVHFLERFLALVGAAACLLISVRMGQVVSGIQSLWPLPGLYLVEVDLVSIAGLLGVLANSSGRFPWRSGLIWAAVGILLAFVVMGALSIGLFFSPALLILAVAAILSSWRQGHNMLPYVGISILAAVAQVVLMLAVI